MDRELKQAGNESKNDGQKVSDNVSEVAAPVANVVEAAIESLIEETKNIDINGTEQAEHFYEDVKCEAISSSEFFFDLESELKSCDGASKARKFYTRELLIEILRKVSVWKPVLPNMDIVLKNSNKWQFAPSKAARTAPLSNSFGASKSFEWDKNRTLHKATNAWKPISKDGTDEEVIMQTMRGLLNKLSADNFDKITSTVKELQLDSSDKLKGCIKLLFEKAVMEPGFSPSYARMAYSLSGISVVDSNTDKPLTFRAILLHECQAEFEKDKNDETIFSELAEKIDSAKTDEEKKRFTDERELAIHLAKKRSLGNVRFIGELFKLNMLSEGIMIHCLGKLLAKHDEENLECLCKLLSTIGLPLELKSKPKVDALMFELNKFVTNKNTSSRIRFMIMNVVDLRKSGWVSKSSTENVQKEKQRVVPVSKSHATVVDVSTKISKPAVQTNKDSSNLDDFLEVSSKRVKKVKPETKSGVKVKSKNKFDLLRDLCNDEVEDEEEPKKVVTFKLSKTVAPKAITVISCDEMELKIKSRIEEYLSLKDLKEAKDTIKELNTHVCQTNAIRFFFISLSQSLEKNSAVRKEVGTLHRHIIDSGIASVESYAKAWVKFAKFANDLIVDIPQVWSDVSEYIIPVILDSSVFKIDVFAHDLSDVDAEIDDKFSEEDDDCTAKLLAAILNGISASKGEAQAKQLWADSGLEWEMFLKHSQFDEFQKKYLKF